MQEVLSISQPGRAETADKYYEAADMLPPELKALCHRAGGKIAGRAEEFRLRRGRPFSIGVGSGEYIPDRSISVTAGHIAHLLSVGSNGSLHSVGESLKNGYITAAGGHRIGICGSAVIINGETASIKGFSSASLRIARELKGIGDSIYRELMAGGFASTLIVSPPGGGKTTLLRDLVRLLSDGGRRVSVADERGEIAAVRDGVCGFDVGGMTDVMDGCNKADGIMQLLKTMSPEIIAVDEITDPRDIKAIKSAEGCGVRLIATMHAFGQEDLHSRELWPDVARLFEKLVLIENKNGQRSYTLEDLETGHA